MVRYCREVIQAKTMKLKGTWTASHAMTTDKRHPYFYWLVMALIVGGFGVVTAVQFYYSWWLSGLVTLGLLLNECDKLRALRFEGRKLKWEDRQRYDPEDDLPVVVITPEGAEITRFRPDRYYRFLRRHRHSFYVDDAIDLPDAEPVRRRRRRPAVHQGLAQRPLPGFRGLRADYRPGIPKQRPGPRLLYLTVWDWI